jgi:membrane protein DedA with SNARE-associated domain
MVEWILGTLSETGYPGILLLMFVENLFPPIPSEVVMPFAGFVAARGELSLPGVVLAGTAGSVIGALPWYWAGRTLGQERLRHLAERYGKWLTISVKDVARAASWFDRHGGKAVFLGRLVPAIRTVISVPAGLARMKLLPFLLYTATGSLLWTTLLASGGYLLESRYELIADYLDPVTKIILAGLFVTYVYRLIRRPDH